MEMDINTIRQNAIGKVNLLFEGRKTTRPYVLDEVIILSSGPALFTTVVPCRSNLYGCCAHVLFTDSERPEFLLQGWLDPMSDKLYFSIDHAMSLAMGYDYDNTEPRTMFNAVLVQAHADGIECIDGPVYASVRQHIERSHTRMYCIVDFTKMLDATATKFKLVDEYRKWVETVLSNRYVLAAVRAICSNPNSYSYRGFSRAAWPIVTDDSARLGVFDDNGHLCYTYKVVQNDDSEPETAAAPESATEVEAPAAQEPASDTDILKAAINVLERQVSGVNDQFTELNESRKGHEDRVKCLESQLLNIQAELERERQAVNDCHAKAREYSRSRREYETTLNSCKFTLGKMTENATDDKA